MKPGRFRKGKKAFRAWPRTRSGKQTELAFRYQRHLKRIEQERKSMFRSVMAMAIVVSGSMQVRAITQQARPAAMAIEEFAKSKVKALIQAATDTAQALTKIFAT